MQLTFNVNKQTLNRSDDEFPASGSKEYLTAKFTFSDDWNGTTKTAVFSRNSLVFNQILDNNGECKVPHDIIIANGAVISVFGTDGTKRITTTPLFVRIDSSGYIEGNTPEPPTPTVYEQIIGKLDEVKSDIPDVPLWALEPDKPEYTASEVGALPDTTIIPDVPTWAMRPEKPIYTAEEVNALPDTTPIPNVPGWAMQSSKPAYTASEVGAIPVGTFIPSQADITGEVITAQLTNNQQYPFNNSVKTISLPSLKNNTNYTIQYEITSYSGGFVGDIVMTEKMLNGFKIASTGSATTVNLKLYIKGGVY